MDSRDIEKWRVELDSYANVEDGVEYWNPWDTLDGRTSPKLLRGQKSRAKQTKLQLIPIFVTPRKW